MNHTSFYQIDLPKDSKVLVFHNGIKALNLRGWLWLLRLLFSTDSTKPTGCLETKIGIYSLREAFIVTYWQDEKSLNAFFHGPKHRKMAKNMMSIIEADPKAISVFNEIYRPIRSGRYFSEPQGLAKIYAAIKSTKVTTTSK